MLLRNVPHHRHPCHPIRGGGITLDFDAAGDGVMEERLHYAQDAEFNVTAVVDTTGSVVERYAYTPYGERAVFTASWTPLTATAYDSTISYTGQRLDLETGLHHFRNRFYSAELGRFITRDPLGYVDGMSLYGGYFSELFSVDSEGLQRVPRENEIDPKIPDLTPITVTATWNINAGAGVTMKQDVTGIPTRTTPGVSLDYRKDNNGSVRYSYVTVAWMNWIINEDWTRFGKEQSFDSTINVIAWRCSIRLWGTAQIEKRWLARRKDRINVRFEGEIEETAKGQVLEIVDQLPLNPTAKLATEWGKALADPTLERIKMNGRANFSQGLWTVVEEERAVITSLNWALHPWPKLAE